MLQTILQDYIDAAAAMDVRAFCRELAVPVLIPVRPALEASFQAAPTRMQASDEGALPGRGRYRLEHRAPVLELRPAPGARVQQVSVGRAEENDLVIQDETVSGRHALVRLDAPGGQIQLQDLESTNGTRVNERQVIPLRPASLRDGDLVGFGDAQFFFYSPAGLYAALKKLLAGGG